jgi:hypothetical protein
MAETLTGMQAQILSKNKPAVEVLLGKPLKVGYWTTATPPEGASAAAVAAFELNSLDEIWIYASGRIHFNLAGTAVKVDDKTGLDLPPNQNIA